MQSTTDIEKEWQGKREERRKDRRKRQRKKLKEAVRPVLSSSSLVASRIENIKRDKDTEEIEIDSQTFEGFMIDIHKGMGMAIS